MVVGRSNLFILASLLAIAPTSASNAKGLAFLKVKESEPDVVKLPSGMLYKVLRKGSGKEHPLVGTSCSCHYEGTLINGDKFDSSYDRGSPTSFAPNQVIKGWTEAMQLMVEGDKWEMYIPSELAYGANGSPPKIGPDEVLIFRMEIIKINGKTKPAITCDVVSLDECDEKQKKFIEKMKAKSAGEKAPIKKEMTRLEGMKGNKMAPENADWLVQRLGLLKRMHEEL
jgi:FKBP-type peptidyl-prolyl cis-trans isomerase FklB